jgi:hypothetical protein
MKRVRLRKGTLVRGPVAVGRVLSLSTLRVGRRRRGDGDLLPKSSRVRAPRRAWHDDNLDLVELINTDAGSGGRYVLHDDVERLRDDFPPEREPADTKEAATSCQS